MQMDKMVSNFPYNIVLGAIADVGDNHFGYVVLGIQMAH